MVDQPRLFGAELRRRRLAAGLTLTQLAQRVHYSKSQLSKVEREIKPPSRELARLCDATLGANGALVGLVPARPTPDALGVSTDDSTEAWFMRVPIPGQRRPQSVSRRQVMSAGAASVPAISIGLMGSHGQAAEGTLLSSFRSLFDEYRQLGQAIDASLLLPTLISQTQAIQQLCRSVGPRTRQGLLLIGSRYAEYVGWLTQESGDDAASLWWTRRAVDLANAADDQHLAAYGLVRQALVALYREDPIQTVDLAQRASVVGVPDRIRGLAAQREAQGHALAGDYDACMRSLDLARDLLGRQAQDSAGPIIGATNLPDSVEMVRGWCLHDLGRPGQAADVIGRQLSLIPGTAVRTQLRYGMRRALACAEAGEADRACHLTTALLGNAVNLRSATIAADLGKLARTLSRYRSARSVRELAPRLGVAVQAASPQ